MPDSEQHVSGLVLTKCERADHALAVPYTTLDDGTGRLE